MTFDVFKTFIDRNTTYIGFGEWVGPTILFAAQFASRCFGLEPDPRAFNELQLNVAVNPDLPIVIDKLCISTKSEILNMSGIGFSNSVVDKQNPSTFQHHLNKGRPIFQVQCVSLFEYLTMRSAFSQNMFIKVDIG